MNKIPFHPILLGLYPVLFLWLNNIDQIPFYAILRALLFSVGLVCIVCLISRLIIRPTLKAAIFASFVLILFFTFGHVFGLLDEVKILGVMVGRIRYFSLLWLILFVIGTIIIWKSMSDLQGITRILNLVSLLLIAILFIQVVLFKLNTQEMVAREIPKSNDKSQTLGADSIDRDVYYIVIDSYGRQDVLQDDYGLDNHVFIQELTDLGFVIPNCTLSNYDNTPFSLTASLDMNYLEALGISIDSSAKNINTRAFWGYLKKSLVRKQFEDMGYKIVAFKTIYPFIDLSDADYYYDLEKTTGQLNKLESLNFQYVFFRTTLLRSVIDTQIVFPDLFTKIPPAILALINPKASVFSSRHFQQYEQNRYALDNLQKIPDIPGKKFIYAHLFITHQPFVFTPDGKFRWPVLDDNKAYRDQILYADRIIPEIIKAILSKSTTRPIIIIQGDHSYTWSQDRNKILNAYFLPDGGDSKLYPSITPVNTFRLVFDIYFGGNYPILPDIVYYSRNERPYDFKVLPTTCVETSGK
jgi:hypothetical protein